MKIGVNPFEFSPHANQLLAGKHFGQDWLDKIWSSEGSNVFSPGSFFQVGNLIPPSMTSIIKDGMKQRAWLAVGLDGKSDHFYDRIGNYRLSNFNQGLAGVLWNRLRKSRMLQNRLSADELDDGSVWQPIGVNPLFRYIRYQQGGQLVGHYDQTYRQDDTHRSLMSLVIYLTSNQHGRTRFLKDPQIDLPMKQKDFADWSDSGQEDDVLFGISPAQGSAIIFDHRLLHDSEPLQIDDPEKIIIRSDIMYEKIQ